MTLLTFKAGVVLIMKNINKLKPHPLLALFNDCLLIATYDFVLKGLPRVDSRWSTYAGFFLEGYLRYQLEPSR